MKIAKQDCGHSIIFEKTDEYLDLLLLWKLFDFYFQLASRQLKLCFSNNIRIHTLSQLLIRKLIFFFRCDMKLNLIRRRCVLNNIDKEIKISVKDLSVQTSGVCPDKIMLKAGGRLVEWILVVDRLLGHWGWWLERGNCLGVLLICEPSLRKVELKDCVLSVYVLNRRLLFWPFRAQSCSTQRIRVDDLRRIAQFFLLTLFWGVERPVCMHDELVFSP